jgi:hypothetical protein
MLQRSVNGQIGSYVGVPAFLIYCAFEPRLVQPYREYVHHWIWSLGWFIRHGDDPTRWGDLLLFCLFYFPYSLVAPIWSVSKSLLLSLIGFGVIVLFVVTIVALLRAKPTPRNREWKDYDCSHPLIHRCRTSHTRMFPKKHSFSYHYLQISIPIGFRGNCGSMVSIDMPSANSWLQVRAEDYLQRDSPLKTLSDRLSAYLRSEVWFRYEQIGLLLTRHRM